MSKAIITEGLLDDIADAIIAKGGASVAMTPAEMASAIANIPSGGTVKLATGTFTGDDTAIAKFSCSFKPDVVYITRINIISLSTRVFAGFIGVGFDACIGYGQYQNNANTTGTSIYSGTLTNSNFTYNNGTVSIGTQSSRPVSSACEYMYYAVKWTT